MRKALVGLIMAGLTPHQAQADPTRLKAVVYRGPASCDGCPEAIGHLLETSPWDFNVTYAGPHEDVDVTAETLEGATIYAHGGGPDLEDGYRRTKKYQKAIREFVSSGGHYLGFCLGAYLAGHSPGYGLLPPGVDTDAEISRHNAEVDDEDDTVIKVDWTFTTGDTEKSRWVYFQDGVVITGADNRSDDSVRIIGRYSKNGDVAATVSPFGQGWVGLVGPHPEATEDWYEAEGFKNPEGVKFDIGWDFINATLGRLNSQRIPST